MTEETQIQPVNETEKKILIRLIVFTAALIAYPLLAFFWGCADEWRSERISFFGVLLRHLFEPGRSFWITFSIYWLIPLAFNIRLLHTARKKQNRKLIFIAIFFFFLLVLPYIGLLIPLIVLFIGIMHNPIPP